MSYLIVQIWFFLLLAALIGLIAGWLLRGTDQEKLNRVNLEWSQRLANVEAERDEYASKNDELGEVSVRQGEMYMKISEERDVLSRRMLERDNGSEADQHTVGEYQQRLAQHEVEVEQLKEQLSETANQLDETQFALHALRGQAETGSAELQNGSEQLKSVKNNLIESEKIIVERDETIEQLHQKLAANQTGLDDTKATLSKSLDEERQKVRTATDALEEAKRAKEEYEERFESVNKAIHEKEQRVNELQQTVEKRESSLKSVSEREAELQKTVNHMNEQLEETQKSLTESNQRQQAIENELRVSQMQTAKLKNQTNEPQQPRDYSGMASGILGGAVGGAAVAKSDGLSSGWSRLSGYARDGYHKVKEKVEDTTSEVVTAAAKASPNDENYRIEVIRSIGSDNRRLLHDMGVTTTLNLLDKCQDPEGIKLISKALGRESWVVSSWVAIADLLRVKGIDGSMAEVLELSGVYSVQSLADANPEKLLQSIKAINQRVEKVGRMPDTAEIAGWVRHAGSLEELIA